MKDAERKAIWLINEGFEPEGRQQLHQRIEALSKDWKLRRNGAQKPSEEVTESELEVEIVESNF